MQPKVFQPLVWQGHKVFNLYRLFGLFFSLQDQLHPHLSNTHHHKHRTDNTLIQYSITVHLSNTHHHKHHAVLASHVSRGGVQYPTFPRRRGSSGLMSKEGTLPCELSYDAFDVTYPSTPPQPPHVKTLPPWKGI